MATLGKIVTPKNSANLAEGFVSDLEKLITPGKVSADSCFEALANVQAMYEAFKPKIKKGDEVKFEIIAERGSKDDKKPYSWFVTFSDIPALLAEVKKVHESMLKADTYIQRPNLPSTKGARPQEVDKSLPDFDALFE